MKKCDYTEKHLPSYGERQEEINEAKSEERDLPVFSREVPLSSERRETRDGTVVTYSWDKSRSDSIKISSMVFSSDEKLGDLYRIDKKDGLDRTVLHKNSRVYILRKTSEAVAKALLRIADRISGSMEKIVGYLKTLMGNFYVLSVVESKAWTFDNSLVCDEIKYLDFEKLECCHRKKIGELIVEKISALHSKNLVLGKFSLDNILVYNNNLKLTDLRNVRASRKKSFMIDEFQNVLKYLISASMVGSEDIPQVVAYYSSENEENCCEWYSETFGGDPEDEVELVSALESHVGN